MGDRTESPTGAIWDAIFTRFQDPKDKASKTPDQTEKLKPLTEVEWNLVAALQNGKEAFSGIEDLVAPAVPLEKSEKCRIRASIIETLCSQPAEVTDKFPQAIRLRGYYIDDKLDLNSLHIPFHLIFKKCVFTQRIDLRCATIESLNLEGSKTEGVVDADGLTVLGDLRLSDGFWASRPFCLSGSRIRGDLNCSKGQFHHNECPPEPFPAAECADCHGRMMYAYSLVLDRLRVDGSLNLCGGFKAEGGVLLTDSHIGGNLNCTKGLFVARHSAGDFAKSHGRRLACQADDDYHQSTAFNGDGMHVGRNFLLNGVESKGEMRLTGALIDGRIECATGNFLHQGASAIYADRLRARGKVFFCDEFAIRGAVRFPNAEFGADFSFGHGGLKDAKLDAPALNCEGFNVQGSVYLTGLDVEGEVDLSNALVGRSIDCTGSKFRNNGIKAFNADNAEIKGSLFAGTEKGTFEADGGISLRSAKIGKDLNCSNGNFNSRRLPAIDLFGVSVGGRLDMRKAVVKGGICLEDGVIGGSLLCHGASFDQPSHPEKEDRGVLISAAKVKVGGSVYFKEFSANGWVRLVDAEIGKSFNCGDGSIRNKNGFAIQGQRMKVGGSIHFNKRFSCEGAITLRSCEVGADLNCSNSTFINKKYCHPGPIKGTDQEENELSRLEEREREEEGYFAISLECAKIGGSAMFMGDFSSEGTVSLRNATIGIDLDCSRGTFMNNRECKGEDVFEGDPRCFALDAQGIKVGGCALFKESFSAKGAVSLRAAYIGSTLQWTNVAKEELHLDLRGTKAEVLCDDLDSWPKFGRLFLTGFQYEYLHDRKSIDVEKRLEHCLEKQRYFRPQPYEQLAAVLLRSGFEEDAKKVQIAKNNQLLTEDKRVRLVNRRSIPTGEKKEMEGQRLSLASRAWYQFLRVAAYYGYRPSRVCWWGLSLVGFGAVLFGFGFHYHLMDPTKQWKEIAAMGVDAQYLLNSGGEHSWYFPIIYSLDTFLPVVDLKAGEYFVPTFAPSSNHPVLLYLIYFYHRILIFSGWIITALLVAALGGLVRK